jgi:hypothetical protein
MLIPNHPHDERLAAYADADIDARADASLVAHTSTCLRCTGVLDELGALRSALAELPDIAPSRPLRLLPPVADAPAAAGAGGWMRRLFAPVMTAGAALAIVGLVGTALPLTQGQAGGAALFSNISEELASDAGAPAAGEELTPSSQRVTNLPGAAAASDDQSGVPDGAEVSPFEAANGQDPADGAGEPDVARATASEERPIWPMLLFAGVAILIGAPLLRWILVPRAG